MMSGSVWFLGRLEPDERLMGRGVESIDVRSFENMIALKGRDEHLPTKNGVPLTIGLFRVKNTRTRYRKSQID